MTFRFIIGPYRNSNFPLLADSAVLAGFFAWPRQPKENVSSNSAANPGGASPQTGRAVNSDDADMHIARLRRDCNDLAMSLPSVTPEQWGDLIAAREAINSLMRRVRYVR